MYSCFPAAEIQCLDLASTHRQSALLHIILALRWVAHCTVLLLLSGWTSLQSLAFLRVIVSGHCPGSPWPRTQMLLVFRSIYMYGWRIKTGFSEGVYLESVRLKGCGVSLSKPGWKSLCLGSVKILQQKSPNFATFFIVYLFFSLQSPAHLHPLYFTQQSLGSPHLNVKGLFPGKC